MAGARGASFRLRIHAPRRHANSEFGPGSAPAQQAAPHHPDRIATSPFDDVKDAITVRAVRTVQHLRERAARICHRRRGLASLASGEVISANETASEVR